MTNFRQKAEECYAAFKETYDPAEAAAADAYNEAADEIERLAAENDWLRNALRASQIGAGLAPTCPDNKNGDRNANPGQ